jgi:hypothetical protein
MWIAAAVALLRREPTLRGCRGRGPEDNRCGHKRFSAKSYDCLLFFQRDCFLNISLMQYWALFPVGLSPGSGTARRPIDECLGSISPRHVKS